MDSTAWSFRVTSPSKCLYGAVTVRGPLPIQNMFPHLGIHKYLRMQHYMCKKPWVSGETFEWGGTGAGIEIHLDHYSF